MLNKIPRGAVLILIWYVVFLLDILFCPHYVTVVSSEYFNSFWRQAIPLALAISGIVLSIFLLKKKSFSRISLMFVSAGALIWGVFINWEYLKRNGFLAEDSLVNFNSWFCADYSYTFLGTIVIYVLIIFYLIFCKRFGVMNKK